MLPTAQEKQVKLEVSKPKIHPLEPWRDIPYTCIHCGKVLKNYAAKNSHLMHCKKRILNRYFKVQNLLFVVHWNPLKRRSAALHRLINEYHDAKLLIGALNYLTYVGTLHNYVVMELGGSPEMLSHPDGWVQFPVIKQKLSKGEMTTFEQNIQKMEVKKKEILEAKDQKKAV
jgi:hypothetical protein